MTSAQELGLRLLARPAVIPAVGAVLTGLLLLLAWRSDDSRRGTLVLYAEMVALFAAAVASLGRSGERRAPGNGWPFLSAGFALLAVSCAVTASLTGVGRVGNAGVTLALGVVAASPALIAGLLPMAPTVVDRHRHRLAVGNGVLTMPAVACLQLALDTPNSVDGWRWLLMIQVLAVSVVAGAGVHTLVRASEPGGYPARVLLPVVAGTCLVATSLVVVQRCLVPGGPSPALNNPLATAGLLSDSAWCWVPIGATALAALLVATVATRRSDESEDRVGLLWRERVAALIWILPAGLVLYLIIGVTVMDWGLSTPAKVALIVFVVVFIAARIVTSLATAQQSRLAQAKAVERTLAEGTQERWFRALVQHGSDVVTVVDTTGTIRYTTPSMRRVLGHDPELIVGTRFSGLLRPAEAHEFEQLLAQTAGRPGAIRSVALSVWHRDGRWRETDTTITSLVTDPDIRGLVLSTRDVSDRRALEQQLTKQAFTDALTGLPNRARFRDDLTRAVRDAAPGTVAVAFCDLNGFKQVNDGHGHGVGDELLTLVARRLANCVRPGDLVARLGGDEFGVLVRGPEAESGAIGVAERIRRTLSGDFVVDDRHVTVGASTGIAVNRTGTEDADRMLRDADLAMYRAKALRDRSYVVFETEMHDELMAQVRAQDDVREAFAAGDIALHYQPVVDSMTGRMVGAEALLCWQHPVRGWVPPREFLQVAGECGLIGPIGRASLEQVITNAAAWQQTPAAVQSRTLRDEPFRVSLNLVARQLTPDFPALVRSLLEQHGLPADALELELNETVLVDPTHREVVTALSQLGVGLTVDDFGTGASSLSTLARLPVSVIKVDSSHTVALIKGEPVSVEVARALLRIGDAVRARTVAEGVETMAQLEVLRSLGVRYVQGYLTGRPVPAAELTSQLMLAAVRPGTPTLGSRVPVVGGVAKV